VLVDRIDCNELKEVVKWVNILRSQTEK
jgi:hypothetical protein